MKKQFKAESKKLLDMMINSIYTNKEIFLRELISNASDALDKLYFTSLTDKKLKVNNDELENNLGTIAKSGSELFKESSDQKKNIAIIGQFGVGFYSAFMVSSKIVVNSKSINSLEGYTWTSSGADGYNGSHFIS